MAAKCAPAQRQWPFMVIEINNGLQSSEIRVKQFDWTRRGRHFDDPPVVETQTVDFFFFCQSYPDAR